jgi:hypothetical protein
MTTLSLQAKRHVVKGPAQNFPGAAELAAALGGRRSGSGYVARCPAHDDRNPSLAIAERDGRLLVHCFAGCEQSAVIAALRDRGLWASREWTSREREAWRREQERRREAERFADAARLLAEQALEALPFYDPDRRHLTDLLERLRRDPGAELRWFLKHHPALAAAILGAGRSRERRLRRRAELWVQALALEGLHAA